MSNLSRNQRPSFTEEQAKILLGKYVLVGIAHCNLQGDVVSREQIHGTVKRANPEEGLVISLKGSNAERAVPLDASQLQMARPGEYSLTGTNEVVVDPDYTMWLTLYPENS